MIIKLNAKKNKLGKGLQKDINLSFFREAVNTVVDVKYTVYSYWQNDYKHF